MTIHCNPEYASCNLTKQFIPTSKDTILTVNSKFKKEVNVIYINSAMVTTYLKTNSTKLSFNRTIDYCAFMKKQRPSDWFLRAVLVTLASSGKVLRSCPIQEGQLFTFEKFSLQLNRFPALLSFQDSNIVVYFNYWTKIKKNYIPMVEAKVFGSFKNS